MSYEEKERECAQERTSKMDEVETEPKPGKYPSLDNILTDEPEPLFLLPCTVCNKTFNPESLQRHSKICEKNAARKRKTFDSFKQRVQGTGMAEFLSLTTIKKNEKPISPKKIVNNWKEKHEAFVSAIRAARAADAAPGGGKPMGSSGDGRGAQLTRPTDHEQCPFCGRHFGPKAFDRHSEWCREQRQRQPPSAASLQARERLEARIKYRAPPCKSKRSLMREKYSPVSQRKVRETSPTSLSTSLSAGSSRSLAPEPPVRYNRSPVTQSANRIQMKDASSNQGLNRGGISRTSLRASQRAAQRSVSPKKPTSSASAKAAKTPPRRPSSRASDRRPEDSLSLAASVTEAFAAEPHASTATIKSASTRAKRKDHSNENDAPSSPQIIPKIESNRSRKTSIQRPCGPSLPLAASSETLALRLPEEEFSFHTCPPPPRDFVSQRAAPLLSDKASSLSVKNKVLSDNPKCVTELKENVDQDDSGKNEDKWVTGDFDSTSTDMFSESSEAGAELSFEPTGSNVPNQPVSVFTCPTPVCEFALEKSSAEQKEKSQTTTVRNAGTVKSFLDTQHPVSKKRRRVSTPSTPGRVDVYQRSEPIRPDVKAVDLPTGLGSEEREQFVSLVFNQEQIIDIDDLSECCDSSDDFALDRSSDEDGFKGRKTSCSASTYTKDRSSLPDGVLRVSSSERDIDLSDERKSSNEFPRRNYSKTSQSSETLSQSPTEKGDVESRSLKKLREIVIESDLAPKIVQVGKSSENMQRFYAKPLARPKEKVESGIDRSKQKGREKSSRKAKAGSDCKSASEAPSPGKSRRHNNVEILPSRIKLPSVTKTREFSSAKLKLGQPFSVRTTSVTTCQLSTALITASIAPPVIRIKNKLPQKLKPLKNSDSVVVSISAGPERTPSKPSEAYDPYQSAERQMLELFNSDSAADLSVASENRKNRQTPAPTSSSSSPSLSPSHSPTPCPPLETSPTSAFTRYSKDTDWMEPRRSPSPIPTVPTTIAPRSSDQAFFPAPEPPPRQHRSVSVQLPTITKSPLTQFKSHHSVDGPADMERPFRSKQSSDDLDKRPRTYDIYSKEERKPSPVPSLKDDSPPDILVVIGSSISPPPEFVELREEPLVKAPKESRESREVRELTDTELSSKDITDTELSSKDKARNLFRADSPLGQKLLELSEELSIDNLMEEVSRMQEYVALMAQPVNARPKQQSAKSRRSRASKMHIEDYLYPADSPMRGNTPIMSDALFNPTVDLDLLNANVDNEDNDVVVSPNALPDAGTILRSSSPLPCSRVDDDVGLTSLIRPKTLPSLCPDSSRVTRLLSEHTVHEGSRRIVGDSDDDAPKSAPSSPVPRSVSNRQSTGSRLSGDSAYSSLNRKSPISSSKGATIVQSSRHAIRSNGDSPVSMLSQSLQAQSISQRDGSSSSSESSLHAVSTSQPGKSLDSGTWSAASRLSKFCHECGMRFPISNAKFCPECGVRRIGM